VAWGRPALAAEATARYGRQIVGPLSWRAGWRRPRILSDGGSEFKAATAAAGQALGIRHARPWPRHAWPQWLRRAAAGDHPARALAHRVSAQCFTSRLGLLRSLDAFMTFYNEQRPHQGYRLRDRTPAEMFTGGAGRAS
jgi:hypothetical protein